MYEMIIIKKDFLKIIDLANSIKHNNCNNSKNCKNNKNCLFCIDFETPNMKVSLDHFFKIIQKMYLVHNLNDYHLKSNLLFDTDYFFYLKEIVADIKGCTCFECHGICNFYDYEMCFNCNLFKSVLLGKESNNNWNDNKIYNKDDINTYYINEFIYQLQEITRKNKEINIKRIEKENKKTGY